MQSLGLPSLNNKWKKKSHQNSTWGKEGERGGVTVVYIDKPDKSVYGQSRSHLYLLFCYLYFHCIKWVLSVYYLFILSFYSCFHSLLKTIIKSQGGELYDIMKQTKPRGE